MGYGGGLEYGDSGIAQGEEGHNVMGQGVDADNDPKSTQDFAATLFLLGRRALCHSASVCDQLVA